MRHFEPAQIEADFLSRLKEMPEHDRNTARWLLENVNGIGISGVINGIPDAHHRAIEKARQALKEAQAEEEAK